jgi:hypothetical protein
MTGSVTKRLLCISVESTYECKTRGEEPWHCPPRGPSAKNCVIFQMELTTA